MSLLCRRGGLAVGKNIFWSSPLEETEPPKEARGSIGGFFQSFFTRQALPACTIERIVTAVNVRAAYRQPSFAIYLIK
jgi:hypothetical protein